jgi:hypothetical protein
MVLNSPHPTLSHRERALDCTFSQRESAIAPSPDGEGWGEENPKQKNLLTVISC